MKLGELGQRREDQLLELRMPGHLPWQGLGGGGRDARPTPVDASLLDRVEEILAGVSASGGVIHGEHTYMMARLSKYKELSVNPPLDPDQACHGADGIDLRCRCTCPLWVCSLPPQSCPAAWVCPACMCRPASSPCHRGCTCARAWGRLRQLRRVGRPAWLRGARKSCTGGLWLSIARPSGTRDAGS